jgi:hypothetical protein
MPVLALWGEVQSDWNYAPGARVTDKGVVIPVALATGLNWQAVDWRVQFLGIEWTIPLYKKMRHLERLELEEQRNSLKRQRSS